jgi:hypothetical protein
MATKKEEGIQLQEIKVKHAKITIEGDGDLVLNKMNDVVAMDLINARKDKAKRTEKSNVWEEIITSMHWRVQEARSVVRNLKIVEVKPDKEPEPTTIRVFYKTDNESGYKPTKLILKKPDEYKALVERCRSELLAIKQKFQNISEYEEIWEMIN